MARRRGQREPRLPLLKHLTEVGVTHRDYVLWWLGSDPGRQHIERPDLMSALDDGSTDELVTLSWAELAEIIATVRENGKQR